MALCRETVPGPPSTKTTSGCPAVGVCDAETSGFALDSEARTVNSDAYTTTNLILKSGRKTQAVHARVQ